MRRLLVKMICSALVGIAVTPTFARQLSVEEAILQAPHSGIFNATRSGTLPVYTEKAGNLNVAYILEMRNEAGYVVLAADDLLPAVLGFSDSGVFDPAAIPTAMKYWLSEYGRQLEFAMNSGSSQRLFSPKSDRKSISPLCAAIWSQSRPFNNNCPTINGTKAPAGCTATAMAQVMYTHKWPLTGSGTNSYLSGTTREKLTFDFGATTFDWANMLPSYETNYSEQQGAAVATLLEACGNAALMSYGETASGAYPYDAVYGMVKFLGYDKSAIKVDRDYFNSGTWDDMIYSELAEGRPVMYGGYDSSYQNGHTFVIDGYNSDGYYHLNWGWGGLSNGYFLLTALDPKQQGIGGSGSGYNYRQDATFHLMPAKENSEYELVVMWNGPFTTTKKAYTPKATVEFIVGGEDAYRGFTLDNTIAVMGAVFTPKEGGESVFYPGTEVTFPSYYGTYEAKSYKNFEIPVASLPSEGEYYVTPAFRHNGIVKEVAVKVGEEKSLIMTCSDRGVKIEEVAVVRTLSADNIKVEGPLYSGKKCIVKADIHNSGEEYLGTVKAGFENSEGNVRTWLDAVPVNLADGESATVIFTGTLNSYSTELAPGSYTLKIFNEAGESITSSPLKVDVQEAPEGKPVIDSSLTIPGNTTGDGSNFSPYLIGNEVDLEITVSVSKGLFDDVVALYAYYDNNTEFDFSKSSETYKSFFVAPGEKQTMVYHLVTSTFELNKTAYIRAYGWKPDWSGESLGWIGRQVYVKRVESGIEAPEAAVSRIYPNPAYSDLTIEAESEIKNVSVYSLTGAELLKVASDAKERKQNLNVSTLQAGHYIVIVVTENGIERHRLIKR